jgi:hypothetical protein
MDAKTADLIVYPALAVTTSAYALALDDNKQHAEWKLEPDWTWVEVAIGVAICLIGAAIRARLGPDDRRTTERAVWLSFLIGSPPIILWQLMRAYMRQKRRGDTIQHYNRREEYGDTTRPAPPLARLRRPGSSTNGGLG